MNRLLLILLALLPVLPCTAFSADDGKTPPKSNPHYSSWHVNNLTEEDKVAVFRLSSAATVADSNDNHMGVLRLDFLKYSDRPLYHPNGYLVFGLIFFRSEEGLPLSEYGHPLFIFTLDRTKSIVIDTVVESPDIEQGLLSFPMYREIVEELEQGHQLSVRIRLKSGETGTALYRLKGLKDRLTDLAGNKPTQGEPNVLKF